MVKIWSMEKVNRKELDNLDEDDDLYVKFKEEKYGMDYVIIHSDKSIGIYDDVLHIFDEESNLKGRIPLDKIEYILKF